MERAGTFCDGLGERRGAEGHDRAEHLYIRRELTGSPAFELALRSSIDRFSAFRQPSFQRVIRFERVTDDGAALALRSEQIPGVRLSELISNAESGGISLDIRAALCLVRQLTSAVASLHEQLPEMAHGALAPERLLLTDAGKLIVVEHVLGAALESLRYPPERYWRELRIPLPKAASNSGPASFDRRADVCALGVIALSLVLGRAVRDDEFPAHTADVLASTWAISASGGFEPLPAGLRGWLGRALQLDARNGFQTAVEARTELDRVVGDRDELASPAHLAAFLEKYRAAFPLPAAPPVKTVPPAATVTSEKPPTPAPLPSLASPLIIATPPEKAVQPAPKVVSVQPAPKVVSEKPPKPAPLPSLAPPPPNIAAPPEPSDLDEPPDPDVSQAPGAWTRAASPFQSWPRVAAVAGLLIVLITVGAFAARHHGTAAPAPGVQSSGTLILSSDPSGTPTTIDGEVRGATPLTLTLPVGQHLVELRVGAVSRSVPIMITPGTRIAQYIELPKLGPAPGQLQVRTEPPGAQVSVDGTARGSSPVLVSDLPPGDHMVTVVNDGGSAKRSVTIEAGATASLVLTLTAPAAPSAGWITVASPIELQLFEHDQLLGSSRSDKIALSAGRHEIDVVNDALGYRMTRTVQVAAAKASAIKIEIPRGTIALNAVPWAEVWIDGERAGETPIGNLSLPIGPHDIVFRHPDLGEAHQTAVITLKEPARVSVDLRKK